MKAIYLFTVIAAACLTCAGRPFSPRWRFVPTDELFASSGSVSIASCYAFCALATGVDDRYSWMRGSSPESEVKKADNGWIDFVQSNPDVPLHTSALGRAVFDDFVTVMTSDPPGSICTNCTPLGFIMDSPRVADIMSATSSVLFRPFLTWHGGSAIPEIPQRQYIGGISDEVNYIRSVLGLSTLPEVVTPVDITKEFCNARHTNSLGVARTGGWKVMNDLWTVPLANVVSKVGKLGLAYRGHGTVLVEKRRYDYNWRRNWTYESNVVTNDATGEVEALEITLGSPTTSKNADVTTSTNRFGRSYDIRVDSFCEYPRHAGPAVECVYEYRNAGASGEVVGDRLYSLGSFFFRGFRVYPAASVDYSTARERIIVKRSFFDDDQIPTVAIGDEFDVKFTDHAICKCTGRTEWSLEIDKVVEKSFGYLDNFSEAVLLSEEEVIRSIDELEGFWISHERNPTLSVESSLKIEIHPLYAGIYAVYTLDGLFLGYADELGGPVTTTDKPADETEAHFFDYQLNEDGVDKSEENSMIMRMTHIGHVDFESDNLIDN